MATATLEKIQLKLQFDAGKDGERQKYKTKTLSNISEEATDDNLLIVSNSIDTLTEKDLLKTVKVVTTDLR